MEIISKTFEDPNASRVRPRNVRGSAIYYQAGEEPNVWTWSTSTQDWVQVVPVAGPAVYRALLTYNGETDLVDVTVLENTLGEVAWTKASTGVFDATLTGGFPLEKTSAILQQNAVKTTIFWVSEDQLRVNTFGAFGLANGSLYYTAVEIRVYP